MTELRRSSEHLEEVVSSNRLGYIYFFTAFKAQWN